MDCIENLVALLIHNETNYESGNLFIDFYLDNDVKLSKDNIKDMLLVLEELREVNYLKEDALFEIQFLINILKSK